MTNNELLESYIKSIILDEELEKTKKIISEIIVNNNYKNYDMLDESSKLKINKILQKIIIYGSLSVLGSAGLGAADMGLSNLIGPVKNILQKLSKNNEEAIKVSINILTEGRFAANKELSKNILKQLAIIMSNRKALDQSSFIIVDDINHMLYHFTNEGILNYTTPVITGRDLDKNKLTSINFTNWLSKTGNLEKYESALKSKSKENSRIIHKLFEDYLLYVDENNQKITESGVYSITAIKQVGKNNYDQDRIAYGDVGKVSIKQGINAKVAAGEPIAIHGTGIKGREEALNKAIYWQKKGDLKKASEALQVVNSYGCINVKDEKLKELISIVSKYESTIVYIMADTGDGVVNFGGKLWENSWAATNFFFKAIEGLGTRMYNKFRKIVGKEPQLQYNPKKFKLK